MSGHGGYVGNKTEWWAESLKGFGWPQGGSRDLGTIEELYQAFKARAAAEAIEERAEIERVQRFLHEQSLQAELDAAKEAGK